MGIACNISSGYSVGRSLSFEHITLMKTTIWLADSTLINENINVPRKSMRGIVILFTKAATTDSEEFVYSNITQVKLTIEGVPNVVYSQGIPKLPFYDEAKRFFGTQDLKDQFMTIEKFYKDKFTFVIDLKSHEDQDNVGHGKRI